MSVHVIDKLKELTGSDLPSEVADKTGIDILDWIDMWCGDKPVSTNHLIIFAKGYDVKLDYFTECLEVVQWIK